MIKNVVLIHGIGGLAREAYFPHLKSACEGLGLKVYMFDLGGYRQNTSYQKWESYFNGELSGMDWANTLVVAQSLGTSFAVKYFSEQKIKIGTYISCAGPFDVTQTRSTAPERVQQFPRISMFFKPSEEQFAFFGNMDFPKYSFYSDNDPMFEVENLKKYSELIGAKTYVTHKGHYSFDDGVIEFDELEDLIRHLVGTKDAKN